MSKVQAHNQRNSTDNIYKYESNISSTKKTTSKIGVNKPFFSPTNLSFDKRFL